MLQEISLGLEGIDYVREELSHGSTYARFLLQLPLEDGEVGTYVPVGVGREVVHDFKASIFLRTSKKLRQDALAKTLELISTYLAGPGLRITMIETYFRPGDEFLDTTKIPYLKHSSEIYYLPRINTIRRWWLRHWNQRETIRLSLGSSPFKGMSHRLSHIKRSSPICCGCSPIGPTTSSSVRMTMKGT